MTYYNEFYSVHLDKNITSKMEQFCLSSFPNECGGVLIGFYSEDLSVANITDITCEKSNRRFSFQRKGNGVIKKLNSLWKEGMYYIGEWHCHPKGSPLPSDTDLSTMRKLSKSKGLNCKEPVLVIIGGSAPNWDYYVCVFTDGSALTLSPKR